MWSKNELKVFRDYREAHHFKGSYDGIGGTVNRKFMRISH